MQSIVVRFFLSLFLYTTSAWLGLFLAIPETNYSPIWLAGGIGAACVFIYGRPALAAIFVGACIVGWNWLGYWVFLSAFGRALQAGVLCKLLGKNWKWKMPDSSLTLLYLAAFVSIITATISPITAYLSNEIELQNIIKYTSTIWMGTLTGILVTFPFVLSIHEIRSWISLKDTFGMFLMSLIACVTLLFYGSYPIAYVLLGCCVFLSRMMCLQASMVGVGFVSLFIVLGYWPPTELGINALFLMRASCAAFISITAWQTGSLVHFLNLSLEAKKK